MGKDAFRSNTFINPENGASGINGGDPEEPAEKALMERPSFSIRTRIILAFLIAFLFSLGIAVASMIYISHLNSSQMFFEKAGEIVFEIQEARRYEKNFFLYREKSDLYEASNHIHTASDLIKNGEKEIRPILGKNYDALTNDVLEYEKLLNRMTAATVSGAVADPGEQDNENQLRLYGHQILNFASDLVDQERIKTRAAAHTYMLTSAFSVILSLIVLLWFASELIRQILRPLSRAVEYTQRIATGDFTPITARKKFRDEFSILAIAINRMIHELGIKQDQLVQSRKMAAVGTLTSGIAHELNNPLNNISITTEALIEGLDGYTDEQKRRMLKDIFTQVERAGATVRNLLDFTRAENSITEVISVRKLIESSLKLVGNEITINRIKSKIEIPEGLSKIRGNFRNLQQVFLNLYLNSIQAMPGGGTITVRASNTGDDFIKVAVSDTGCGIPKENIDKIFDPFFTTKEVGVGTGLGLSVSYGIVQKLGGRISVESEPGEGAVFSVFLPVEEEVADGSPEGAMMAGKKNT